MYMISAHACLHMQTLYRDMKKTCNIEAYVEWFNRLSYLVATEICVVRICVHASLYVHGNVYRLTRRGIEQNS